MHEIRATIPPEDVPEALRLARSVGIEEATTREVFVHGPGVKRVHLSVETSTPKAQAFTKALTASNIIHDAAFSLTSREIRAIVNRSGSIKTLTRPMPEPLPDVVQDLWQLSHVTLSYIGRAFAGAVILATGIIENNPIAIVVAALFLPFLAQVVAVGVGLRNRDAKLVRHGLKAIVTSVLLAFLGGVCVAAFDGSSIAFQGFKGPLSSFALSAVIGVTAGLSTTDDTGRRYLIGVAAAVQLALFPVWLGAVSVIGMPSREIVLSRLMSFLINLFTIAGTSLTAAALAERKSASVSQKRMEPIQ